MFVFLFLAGLSVCVAAGWVRRREERYLAASGLLLLLTGKLEIYLILRLVMLSSFVFRFLRLVISGEAGLSFIGEDLDLFEALHLFSYMALHLISDETD